MYTTLPDLVTHALDGRFVCHVGRLPEPLLPSAAEREQLWEMHPSDFPRIFLHGRWVSIPRWQQAYGADYHFSGQASKALSVPTLLAPLQTWARVAIDARINGLLVNWYDAELNHYIGAHRDSTKMMCPGAPIVMVTYGASRTMRLRRWKGKDHRDFVVTDGTVCVMPYDTNLAWTHEILHRKRDIGRRVSVTLRAFQKGILD
ncbi:MAG: alpha-ketoglutarate-dependent dioxygenase AlkB [Planctomycetes bacterium]|nr:alpha-ketoglutarate-dependent dioxygenase AlkB [Planctomycetota bacterium]